MLFPRRTKDQTADFISRYLPGGRLFDAKWIPGTNLRNLLKGFSSEFMKANELLNEMAEEFLPDTTTRFLDEWERAVGIPDDCFLGTGPETERRRDILVKLASLGAQTGMDFENVADIFGISATVVPGMDSGITFAGGDTEARHTIVVDVDVEAGSGFVYDFELVFASSEVALLNCIFDKIKPSVAQVIVREVS